MAGLLDFSQIFTDCDVLGSDEPDVKTRRSNDGVPEPPVFTDIPDLDTLLGGDSRNSLLDLQPSQWLPLSQMSEGLPPDQTRLKKCQSSSETVSERGDGDDMYLGSQYPLVHKIGPSQVPKSNQGKVWNFQSSQRQLSQTPQSQINGMLHSVPSSQGSKNRAFVCPRKAGPSVGYNFNVPKTAYGKDITNASVNRRNVSKRETIFTQPENRIHSLSGERTITQPKNRIHSPTEVISTQDRMNSPMRDSDNNSQEDLFEHSEYNTTVGRQTPGRRKGIQFNMPNTTPSRDQLYTPAFVAVPLEQCRLGVRLRPVTEIPENFRHIFSFPHFNIVQSKVFDDVMYTDKSLVLCSPTGSGKTAVFEMAIVRLMTRSDTKFNRNFKIVYMAPIKALCSERFNDWKEKFEPYGLKVIELTGDTDTEEFYELQQVNIVLTTPEKWDSMTRKWRDNKSVMQAICLFLIDEIHILNDPSRGSVVEAVVSRMKTIQAARQRTGVTADFPVFRFIAISATITNIEDLAEWLGQGKNPALHYKFDDSARPVRLRKVVLGYHFAENKQSEFQFDISLSYKLAGVINTYSDDKPTLIFCATRKSSMQGAEIIAKDVKSSYVRSAQHRLALQNHSFHIKDAKLRDLVVKGIGYHHAGMDVHDRKLIEEVFANGGLPVLVATSTLAMGVNLPAHLVIVKSTMFYNMGSHQEYPDTQVLQMIGRAGRPQFDTSATAVIMTKNTTKMKYENLLNGTQEIESSLHKNLVEHLNAEIVLNTITDISVAVEWLKYTFLYIRVMKNPSHYGMPNGLTKQSIEKRLQDLCIKGLNQLHRLNLIQMNEENMDVKPTESGRLMARYCISYKTAELFLAFKGDEKISDMLNIMSKCEEFDDIKLRNNEKKTLNTLNKDKNRITIRYPMTGKIKTADMKVNCLMQATLGSLLIQDFALQQDTARIFRAGIRVTRCLVELLSQKNNFRCLLSALLLCKCFKAKLWEDSKYVSKQLDGIGPTLSTALVNAGLTSFEKIEKINPREIELIVNRHPPFGNQVKESIVKLPKYELVIEQVMRYSVSTAEIVITIQITNREALKENGSTGHTCTLLVGDADNKVLYKQRLMDALLLKETSWSKKLEVSLADNSPELSVHYISQDWVGLDVECTYTPNYLGGKRITSSSCSDQQAKIPLATGMHRNCPTFQPCQHSCHNKQTCAHECCKNGVTSKRRNNPPQPTPKPASTKRVANHVQELKNKALCLPPTPSVTKRPRLQDNVKNSTVDLTNFAYTPNRRNQASKTSMQGQHLAVSDDFSTYGQPIVAFSKYNSQKNQTVLSGRQCDPFELKAKTDWAELDMYAKYRQTCNKGEDNFNGEDSPLPDLETTFEELADPGPNWHAVQNEHCLDSLEDDFAYETDYGYTYVSGEDQIALPIDWEDRSTEQWQKNGSRDNEIGQKRKQVNRYVAQTMVSDRNNQLKQEPSNGVRVPHWKQSVYSTKNTPGKSDADLRARYQSDYEIEDYSDESFEAAVNGEPVSSRLDPFQKEMVPYSTQVTQSIYGENRDQVYNQDSSGAMQHPYIATVAKDVCNKISNHLHYSAAELEGCRVIPNVTTPEDNNVTGVLANWNVGRPKGTKRDTSARVCTQVDSSEVENHDPELYDDIYNEELEGNKSKWTNFFSSQSSTASDNLNWKYPARNGKNEVVMETCNTLQAQSSQQQSNTGHDRTMNHGTGVAGKVYNDGLAHKYGQVLAWVSNPENHQSSGLEEKKQKNTKSSYTDQQACTNNDKRSMKLKSANNQRKDNCRTPSFFSTTKSPDKMDSFTGIFEGIL